MPRVLSLCIVLAAVGAAVVEPPAWAVRVYGERWYPALQSVVTPLSNRVAVPIFDLVGLALVVGVVATWAIGLARAVRRRSLGPLARLALVSIVLAAGAYLWFVLAWGYNYRRPGVDAAWPGFNAGRVTPAAVRALAERAVVEVNRLHGPAHAQGFPAIDGVAETLVSSLHEVERRLGRARPTTPSIPKRPLTAPYMRAVGVSGMLAPLVLETYLNPDLTGPERPCVLAHEWAHLSGFAPEEDASFVGVVAALRADVASQYSAWLCVLSEASGRLQPVTRELVLASLADGPRRDQEAIAARLRSRVPWLDRASWVAYDRALKSQGAESGVGGYGRVIELLLGSRVLEEEGGRP